MRNETISQLVRLVRTKTPEVNKYFTTMMVMNKVAQIVGNMRGKISYMDGSIIPLNMYGVMLATSGYGKGKTNNILEENITNGFIDKFMNSYAPKISSDALEDLSERNSVQYGTELTESRAKVMKEWDRLPKHLYSFSDATLEGFKAKRVKLSMIDLGATNLEVDEIGLALERISDIIGLVLEVYDGGKAKSKLIKVDSNSDAKKVPANVFFFGTPSKLLSGGRIEKLFIEFLDNGYARRTVFGYIEEDAEIEEINSADILASMRRVDTEQEMRNISDYLARFASDNYHNKIISVDDKEAIMILDYKTSCENRSRELRKHQEIQKAELKHRHWKMFKIAGILSFIDNRNNISEEDVLDAIEFVEESGQAFDRIMNRSPNHERLLDFILDQKRSITQADLVESLHFYGQLGKVQKEEMLVLASSFAYSHNAVITRKFNDGVEFISAKILEDNSGEQTILSISTDITEGYDNKIGKFDNLKNILKSNFHYCSHHFNDGYRDWEHARPKFNIVILDIDDGDSLQLVMALMNDYKYLIGTTKRHQKEGYGDRFRMVLQLDRTIELDRDEHSMFMENIFNWLPFNVDTACKDIARKYMGYPEALLFENEGQTIPSIDFIPHTSKSINTAKRITDLSSLDSLERWFSLNSSSGNRNNLTHRFAMMLVDGGLDYETIEEKVRKMNDSLDSPLPERELYASVFTTVRKKLKGE